MVVEMGYERIVGEEKFYTIRDLRKANSGWNEKLEGDVIKKCKETLGVKGEREVRCLDEVLEIGMINKLLGIGNMFGRNKIEWDWFGMDSIVLVKRKEKECLNEWKNYDLKKRGWVRVE